VDGDVYQQGVEVEFFGRPYSFPAGPGVLAQRTGAQVICGYCERVSPGRFRIVIEKPLDPAAFATTAALNQAVAATIEQHIRGHLDQWCIFRPMWEPSTSPAAEPVGDARSAEA
jgi:KDO2-lipid IV(A) lauroyltransferase